MYTENTSVATNGFIAASQTGAIFAQTAELAKEQCYKMFEDISYVTSSEVNLDVNQHLMFEEEKFCFMKM